jgi:hypothetical protein
MRWEGHVARMQQNMNAYRISAEKPKRMRPLREPYRRREDDIELELRVIGFYDMD